jgi:hypothetical protein
VLADGDAARGRLVPRESIDFATPRDLRAKPRLDSFRRSLLARSFGEQRIEVVIEPRDVQKQ